MNGFWWLSREALADAMRRRIAGAVVVAALISVAMLDSCTSCTPSVTTNGQVHELAEFAGVAGLGTFVVLGLWLIVLAGVLAADHLQSTLEDGSALLSLARPISRETFALGRLAGVLGLVITAGAIVLGAAALMLHSRSSLPLGPALAAGAACALGCVTVAALAMAASLALPRAATLLAVLGGVWLTAFANGLAAFTEVGGWLGALSRVGPPLASTMGLSLAPWLDGVTLSGDPVRAWARLAAWAFGALILLAYSFRRVELRG